MLYEVITDLTQLVILDICRVQSAQLRHTRGDLVSAVARIIKNLQEIGRSVGHIARQTRVVAGAAEGEKVTFFEEIEPVIDAVSSILAQSATVITSYSIHYTKLYDGAGPQG